MVGPRPPLRPILGVAFDSLKGHIYGAGGKRAGSREGLGGVFVPGNNEERDNWPGMLQDRAVFPALELGRLKRDPHVLGAGVSAHLSHTISSGPNLPPRVLPPRH